MQMMSLALLALAGAAHADKATFTYLYCQDQTTCDSYVDVAVAHAENITNVILGSHMCRISEFKASNYDTWCDYGSNYTKQVQRLQAAGMNVFLNAAGPHHLAEEPFYTTGNGTARMTALADQLGAVGWGFDLESSDISLDTYTTFFKMCKTAFAEKDYKVLYTSGRHFTYSEDYADILPIVDYVLDMGTYNGDIKKFNVQWAKVPADLKYKYVPGASSAPGHFTPTIAQTFLAHAEKLEGLENLGFFTISSDPVTPQFFWDYFGEWLAQ